MPITDIRTAAAVAVGKLAGEASRVSGRGGGSSVPGVLAQKLYPNVLRRLVADADIAAVAVTGSNGKTTTSRFLTAILRGQGRTVAHNRDGANLEQGVVTLALEAARWTGHIDDQTLLVLEVDEGALRLVAPQTQPRVLVVTNLFRDQLDRFGEIYALSDVISYVARRLPATSTLVVNADDPLTAELGVEGQHQRITFGLDLERSYSRITSAADSIRCPRCRGDLVYRHVYLSHLGRYQCLRCDFVRPTPDVAVVDLTIDGLAATRMRLRTPEGELDVTVPQPGLHVAYDVAGAVAAVLALGGSLADTTTALAGVGAAFGRLEPIVAGDKDVVLAFAKNPTSFNTNVATLVAAGEPRHLLVALSNTRVDGEDFGWLWDVSFEEMVPTIEHLTLSGTRADEIATRLKYAGVPVERTQVVAHRDLALDMALAHVPTGGRLIALAGYTPTIELRDAMRDRGWVGNRWDD